MKNIKMLCKLVAIAGFILCLSATENTSAASQPLEKQYRASPDGEGALTPKMIKSCISLKKELNEKYDKAMVMKELLDKMADELSFAEKTILEEEKTVDKGDQAAVEAHSAKLEAYRERYAGYQKKTDEYKAVINFYEDLDKKYKKLCVDQQYYEDDYEQAKQEMGYGLE